MNTLAPIKNGELPPLIDSADLPPLPYESFRSIIARLAWGRGVRTNQLLKGLDQFALKDAVINDFTHGVDAAGALSMHPAWKYSIEPERALYGTDGAILGAKISPGLRFCPICLESCYHSYLYQWEALALCPIHDCPLVTRCADCGEPTDRVGVEAIGRQPYLCRACKRFLSGASPDIEGQLNLWRQATLIQGRLAAHDEMADRATKACRNFEPIISSLQAEHLDPEFAWADHGHFAANFAGQLVTMSDGKGVLTCRGISTISWRQESGPEYDGPVYVSQTWAERTRFYVQNYRSYRRLLAKWIFGGEDYWTRAGAAMRQFANIVNAEPAGLPTLPLAYVVWCHSHESFNHWRAAGDDGLVQIKDWPRVKTRYGALLKMSGLTYRAWLIASFSIILKIIERLEDQPVGTMMRLTQLVNAIVPISCWSVEPVRLGVVCFPETPGLPTEPFRRGRQR